VYDGDLDLTNNYAERHYAPYYGEYYLNPHVRLRADGQAVLTHNLGLSFVIAPAYALGGYVGVLYFFAIIGALLAGNVFLLGYDLTGNWLAALVGWAAVSLTPPVLWYTFLVYPEALAALALIIATRCLLKFSPLPAGEGPRVRGNSTIPPQRLRSADDGPGVGAHHAPRQDIRSAAEPGLTLHALLSFSLPLALLPWLSSRFLLALGLFVAWALWLAWRQRSRAWLAAAALALSGLAGYMLFSAWLYGSASPAASYAGPIPLAVERSFVLLRAGRGLLGWLFDTQRGLLITAPIYAAALWGAGLLLGRRPVAGLVVLVPFAAALLPVALWGGFWTGWEYSARFLIAALPLLGAGVADLWAAGPAARAVPVTLAFLAFSLWSGAAVLAQPLRGILSSPVELLKPRLNLEAIVPAMARYAFIPAGQDAVVGAPIPGAPDPTGAFGGAVTTRLTTGPTWEVPAGASGLVLRQVDLPEFPFGWYSARLPLVAPGAAPDDAVARISVFSPSGGSYFSTTVFGSDLPTDGVYRFRFYSPLYNGWGYPPTILVSATGQAAFQVGLLTIEPDLFHSLGLALLWFVAVAGLGSLMTWGARLPRPRPFAPRPWLSLGLALLALASLGLSLRPQARTYAAVDLQRTVGDPIADPAAFNGRAMQATPAAGHEAGRLAYTFAEPYPAGAYRLTVSLTVLPPSSPLDPAAILGSARVTATDADTLAQRWDFTAADIPADGNYYSLHYVFENPAPQALIFVLEYAGSAGLRVDRLIVESVP
jgi:hypothetical protein